MKSNNICDLITGNESFAFTTEGLWDKIKNIFSGIWDKIRKVKTTKTEDLNPQDNEENIAKEDLFFLGSILFSGLCFSIMAIWAKFFSKKF